MRCLLLRPNLGRLMVSTIYYWATALTAREAKVGHLARHATILPVQHGDDVRGLDVSVDDAFVMDVRQVAGRIVKDPAQTNGKMRREDLEKRLNQQ